jgi:hypothetical protein
MSVASCRNAIAPTNEPNPLPLEASARPMLSANTDGICATSSPPQTRAHHVVIQRV